MRTGDTIDLPESGEEQTGDGRLSVEEVRLATRNKACRLKPCAIR